MPWSSSSAPRDIDVAAHDLSVLLHSQGVSHAYIGSYATDLIGGECVVPDLDLIVSQDPAKVRKRLLEDDRFRVNSQNKLLYCGWDSAIELDLFRGGGDDQIRLPDVQLVERSSVFPTNDRKRMQSDCKPFLQQQSLIWRVMTDLLLLRPVSTPVSADPDEDYSLVLRR
ncbi:hypothetical protein N7486_009840 [Penicillium sp. IBT 16267x]|nr:hypothetical protein N7486_009840 [Penicillium sp. IBT 16267x]